MADNKIRFAYDETTYTLEFDRASAVETEKLYDLKLQDLQSGKVSAFDALMRGAFIKHHPSISQERIDAIADALDDKQALYGQLAVMYANTLNSMLTNPPKAKAVAWKVL